MTAVAFAIISLRLLGIYLVTEAVTSLSNGAFMATIWLEFQHPSAVPAPNAVLFSIWSSGALQLLEGILLLVFSAPLARRLIPSTPDESGKPRFSLEEVQAIAFTVTGILIVAMALPTLGRAVEGIYNHPSYQGNGRAVPLEPFFQTWMYSIIFLGQLIIGLVLILNVRGLGGAWRWLRTAGTKPTSDSH